MPRLYFGSRGGVYYKRKGRKVYVTNSFGNNKLPKITRFQDRNNDQLQVKYESTENPGAFHKESFHEWYSEAIMDNVPIETLMNPEIMIPWIKESCISPLDFMTKDLWETLLHSDIKREWKEFENSDDGKIYWFLLWTIVAYLQDTPEQDRYNTWNYIINEILKFISIVTNTNITQKMKDKHEKLEIKWRGVDMFFKLTLIRKIREALEEMEMITQI